MQKSITWFYIFLKNQICQWETAIVCGCMILSLVFVNGIMEDPAKDNFSIAIYVCGEDVLSLRMKTMLVSADSIFTFYEADSEEELKGDVASGKYMCGFVVESEFEEKLKRGEQENCITYICSRETAQGRVAKETVYAQFFRLLSEQLISKYGVKIVGEKEDSTEVLSAFHENNRRYLEGDELFQAYYLDSDLERKQEKAVMDRSNVHPVEGLFVSFLLFGMLLVNAENRSLNRKKLLFMLTPMERVRFRTSQYMAVGCIIGAVGEYCLWIMKRPIRWNAEWIGLSGALLLGIIWAMILDRLFSKEITYHVWMVSILLFHILVSPVFFRIEEYVPISKWVQWISPIGFYLHILDHYG